MASWLGLTADFYNVVNVSPTVDVGLFVQLFVYARVNHPTGEISLESAPRRG